MNVIDFFSLALAVLAVLVSIHLSVFWLVKFMYPPPPPPAPVVVATPPVLETPPPLAAAIAQAEFTLPPYETRKPQAPNVFTVGAEQQQEVNVPTHTPNVPLDVARSEVPGTTDISALQDRPAV